VTRTVEAFTIKSVRREFSQLSNVSQVIKIVEARLP